MNQTPVSTQRTSALTGTPVLQMRGITKRFPGVVALYDVSMDVYPGQVHALVGENGAGKSTLMKVLVGAYQPDEGEIQLNGQPVRFHHPREAQLNGLSIIYQEFNLLPDRTVAQNIFLGREPARHGLIDNRTMTQETIRLLAELDADSYIRPDAFVKTLSVAEQQIVEIAKALSFESRVVVMDEPTAALTTTETQILFRIVRALQARGIAIIYISHRFDEIFELADVITVLKDGALVATVDKAEVDSTALVKLMVGREFDQYYPAYAQPEDIGSAVLDIRNGGNDFLEDITLSLRRGEIVGIAGLQGAGRTELASAIFGVTPFTRGQVTLNGQAVAIRAPLQAIRHGFGFLTEDRKGEGLSLLQSVGDNVLLASRGLHSIFARLGRSKSQVGELMTRVDVRAAGQDQEVQYLSGGNQQKVVLAKWLATDATLLIFDEPTRGIDVKAKSTIHDLIRQLARSGKAILMISSELPEVIGMSDRIIVMRDGRIAGELQRGASETDIMLLATGEARVNQD
jgi:ribose transport system ATP-binding protein